MLACSRLAAVANGQCVTWFTHAVSNWKAACSQMVQQCETRDAKVCTVLTSLPRNTVMETEFAVEAFRKSAAWQKPRLSQRSVISALCLVHKSRPLLFETRPLNRMPSRRTTVPTQVSLLLGHCSLSLSAAVRACVIDRLTSCLPVFLSFAFSIFFFFSTRRWCRCSCAEPTKFEVEYLRCRYLNIAWFDQPSLFWTWLLDTLSIFDQNQTFFSILSPHKQILNFLNFGFFCLQFGVRLFEVWRSNGYQIARRWCFNYNRLWSVHPVNLFYWNVFGTRATFCIKSSLVPGISK